LAERPEADHGQVVIIAHVAAEEAAVGWHTPVGAGAGEEGQARGEMRGILPGGDAKLAVRANRLAARKLHRIARREVLDLGPNLPHDAGRHVASAADTREARAFEKAAQLAPRT